MKAVGKLGSYISKSVYTVSAPFHPFGGAVDIIVVEQQDGTFKSSPWYVRFGKFQGVLKAKEKEVSISVNDVEADFHMYLDHKGEAYFLRELDIEEGDILLSPSTSGDDTDEQSSGRGGTKSKSCKCDAYESYSVTQIDIRNGNVVSTRTNSRQSRIFGLVFGRKSMKEDRFQEEDNNADVVRTESLERAEIAADLLEVKWSTNLASPRRRKDTVSRLSSQEISEGKSSVNLQISDGQENIESLRHDNMANKLQGSSSAGDEKSLNPHSNSMTSERSMEGTGIEMSLQEPKYVIGTSLAEDDAGVPNLEISSNSENLCANNAAKSENVMDVSSEIASTESQIQDSVKLESCLAGRCQKTKDFDDKYHSFSSTSLIMDDNEAKSSPSFLYCETSTSSTFQLDALNKEAAQTLCLSSGLFEQNFAETLQKTDLVYEMNYPLLSSLDVKESSSIQQILEKKDSCIFSNDGKSPQNTVIDPKSMKNGFVTETYLQKVTFQPVYDPVHDMDSQSSFTISTFSNSTCQPLVENDIREDKIGKFEPPLEPVAGPQVSFGDHVRSNVLQSESSEEGLLPFGDLDDLKGNESRQLEEPSSLHNENDGDLLLSPVKTKEENQSFIPVLVSRSSADCSGQDDLPHNAKDLTTKLRAISSECNIPAISGSQSEEVVRIARSLPNMWTHNSGLYAHDLDQSSDYVLDLDSNSFKSALLKEDVLINTKAKADSELQSPKTPHASEDAKNAGELKNGRPNTILGDPSISFDGSHGNWRVWSFPFKRSRSMKVSQSVLDGNKSSDAESAGNTKEAAEDEKDMPKMKASKKKIRATIPTCEQLASLNLKEGRNIIAFTFSTPMLGKQQVDAQIYLWKWDAQIVISDVDGTITRSDLLGQVMPMVGVDWSQTGVTHLFSAIRDNGYQILFLSARSISQAYHTRQFLLNLKQDGKALPEGPVIISPDGLFPSLYREVVRRAPHEFKISCLEDIKALFPSDRNPFYAGFGNRDTDKISYLKVGIPEGKIFIVNPKGEIVVNRRVDTKSYTSLHTLVHGMFPPVASSEQEDFNSWNYWKLPPPAIDV